MLTDQSPECSEISVGIIELVTIKESCVFLFFFPGVSEVTEVRETEMVDWAREQSDDRDLTITLEYLQKGKEPTEAEPFLRVLVRSTYG